MRDADTRTTEQQLLVHTLRGKWMNVKNKMSCRVERLSLTGRRAHGAIHHLVIKE